MAEDHVERIVVTIAQRPAAARGQPAPPGMFAIGEAFLDGDIGQIGRPELIWALKLELIDN